MPSRILNKSPTTAKAGWPLVRLGDFSVKIGSGSTPRGGEAVYVKKGVPLIRSMNVHFDGLRPEGLAFITKSEAEKLKNVTIQEGDVLLNITGASIGRVTTVPGELAGARVNQHVCIIRPTAALHPKFLAYFFATPVEQMRIDDCQVGATRQALTKKMIEDWQVPMPSLEEQLLIVAEIEKQFTRLEVGLTALRRVQANLKRYRAAVLKAACEGRLVPTEVDLAGSEGCPFESGQQLLARILNERRQNWQGRGKYKEPEMPDIKPLPKPPEGWTWASVDQIATVALGKMLDKAKHQSGQKMRYLRNINVRWGRVDTSNCSEMYFDDDEMSRFGVSAGDVLVCEGGEPGRAAVWDGREQDMMYQKAIHRVRFLGGFQPRYLVFVLEFLAKTGRLENWFTGITIKHFTRESFIALPIPLPPLAEQTRIVAEVERRLSVVEELEAVVTTNLQRAKRLRGSTLAAGFRSERYADQGSPPAKVKPAPSSQTVKPIRQIISPMKKHLKLSPESLVETVRGNKGKMTPSDLCLASNVEEEVEGFFEVLRECRERGLLIVPSGIGAIIKLAKS